MSQNWVRLQENKNIWKCRRCILFWRTQLLPCFAHRLTFQNQGGGICDYISVITSLLLTSPPFAFFSSAWLSRPSFRHRAAVHVKIEGAAAYVHSCILNKYAFLLHIPTSFPWHFIYKYWIASRHSCKSTTFVYKGDKWAVPFFLGCSKFRWTAEAT